MMRKVLCRCQGTTSPFRALLVMNQERAKRWIAEDVDASMMSQKIPTFHVCHIDSEGRTAKYEVAKSAFYNELGLTARDLRFQHSHMLTARNCKMIVRAQRLKAVICPNAVLFVDSIRSQSAQSSPGNDHIQFCDELPTLLTGNKLHTKHLPFEYRVLEAILLHNVNEMVSEISELQPKIKLLLENLTDPTNMDVDRSRVHILLQNTASLNRFATTVKEYCQMINDILECEEDLKELCISVEPDNYCKSLSQYHVYVFNPCADECNTSENGDKEGHLTQHRHGSKSKYRINLLDEMEVLLDSYLKEGEEISNKVTELKQAIEDSNSAILINLDSHRNMLLKLELQLTMGMFSCTYFGMLGMAFGMNLNSSLEENPVAFWAVTGTMFAGAGTAWLVMLKQIKKRPDSTLKKIATTKLRSSNQFSSNSHNDVFKTVGKE